MLLIWEVFLPQQPGETISMTDCGMDNPARFTPYPSAPGELYASVAGELKTRCFVTWYRSGIRSDSASSLTV